MLDIDKKDIQAFGRVLRTIGESIEKNPSEWLTKIGFIFEGVDKHEPKKEINVEKIQNLNLYEIAKTMSKDELSAELKQFNVFELQFILKKYKFGYSKLKSVNSLTEYIADQATKRTTDVFQYHEK